MRKYFCLLLFCPVLICRGQELKSIHLNPPDNLEIISLVTNKGTLRLTGPLPLFSLEVNGRIYKSNEEAFQRTINNKILSIQTTTNNGFTDGVKTLVTISNISNRKIKVSNIIPFANNPAYTYISGKPLSDTSRSFLYTNNRSPVGVVVPHNNNDLNFCVVPLPNHQSLYGLLRRANDSIQNYLLIRTPYTLQPGKSISFFLFTDIVNGDWHNAIYKCFNEKMLYEVNNFDNTLYKRQDLSWIQNAYTIHLMMAWNKDYFSLADNSWHLPAFLTRMKSLFGGDDVFAIWPTWPGLGLDQRTQWNLMEDLPGGLAQQKALSTYSHSIGTKYFISYNPWDDASERDAMENMSKMLARVDADGVVLDTKAEASKALQDAADRAKPGVIMYSEGMAVPKDMQGIISGRVHNDIYHVPLVNLNKLIKPGFAIFRVAEIGRERIRREYASAFFNGYGVEINVMRQGVPSWLDDDYRFWGRCVRILKENSGNFHSPPEMLVPTLKDSIYVNQWARQRKTVYTVFSLLPAGYDGKVFEILPQKDSHVVDVWNHRELKLKTLNGKSYASFELQPFNRKFLGTNNEGAVGAIIDFPKLLTVTLNGDKISISAKEGTMIKAWQGNPSYGKTPLVINKRDSSFHLFQTFGRTEGKYVIQLMDSTELLDEQIVWITPGTPLLISETQETAKTNRTPEGMVKIPAGRFTMQVTNGDDFISYPKGYPKIIEMNPFYMDVHPVTNSEFQRFLQSTHYTPADTVNFLKHWIKRSVPAGLENYPVVNISYEDAKAYASWAGKRLPTEAEWQYAAQTGDGRSWPWGNEVKKGKAAKNISATLTLVDYGEPDSTLCNTGNGRLDPVGKYTKGANPYGLTDLVGSVWQLTNDRYQNDTYDYIIMKGGSYYKPGGSWWYVQGGPKPLAYRQMLLRLSQGFERNNTVGFRCVKDAQ